MHGRGRPAYSAPMDYYKGAPVGDSAGVDPQAVGMFGVGASAIGGLMSVIGAFYSASAQKSRLEAEAEIAQINRATAESAARTALMVGQREEQRSRLATAQLKGHQQAALAANGVDLGEGSAQRVIASTDVLGEIDANTIAANAVRNAWGYRTQAGNYRTEAVMKEASADAVSPWSSAASSLLTSATQVAGSWYQFKRGAPPSGG